MRCQLRLRVECDARRGAAGTYELCSLSARGAGSCARGADASQTFSRYERYYNVVGAQRGVVAARGGA
jgi:hypothetical protein